MNLSAFLSTLILITTPESSTSTQLVLYSDPLTSLGTSWMSSGAVRIASAEHCIGTPSCIEMHGYSELYFHEFSLIGTRSAAIGFNLCFGCGDIPSPPLLSASSPFYIYFQCIPSPSTTSSAPWKLLKSYPPSNDMTRYPNQRLLLPPECDNAVAANLVFTARSFSANVYVDSFTITVDGEMEAKATGSLGDRLRALSAGTVPSQLMENDITESIYMKNANIATEQSDHFIKNVSVDSVTTLQTDTKFDDQGHSAEAEWQTTDSVSTDRFVDDLAVDLMVDADGDGEEMAGWMQFEWSLKYWWMLYLSVFVIGIMIGSVTILLGLLCLKCHGKVDVSVREKWVAFTCVFAMGIVVGSALIAATVAFIFKLI